ncbi:MAG: S41 family peptidase [Bacillaceae bacterium]
MKKSIIAAITAGSFACGAIGMYTVDAIIDKKMQIAPKEEAANVKMQDEDMKKFEQAFGMISNNYVQKVKDDKLVEGAIKGMLETLDDPYSVYMDKKTMEQFQQSLDSSFEGIGAEVSKEDEVLKVVSPIKDSPAQKAGLKPNDQILKVDGKSIEGLSQYEAVLKIRGEKGSTVTLTVKRPGVDELLTFKIVRDTIPQFTVFSEMKKENGKDIGYLHITSFSEDTAKEFKEHLGKLESQGIKGLIIDVRGNPGGYLDSVKDILNELVVSKKPIVQVENRNGTRDKQYSNNKTKKEYPITVLIDNGSASASEILAGALNETMDIPLVGEKTFGKGSVQQALPLADGSSIKLTLFKWLTPDGNWINKKGIEATTEVKQPAYYNALPIDVKEPLKYDDNNAQVKNAQVMLDGLGYKPGRTDGYFSKETENAVKAFQQQNNVSSTGVIDKKTAEILQAKLVEKIRSGKDDVQLQKALELTAK